MGKPTEKMRVLAIDIAKRCDLELPDDILEDFEKTRDFIDENINKPAVKRKLSDKQIEVANKAGGELAELAKEVWLSEEELKRFHGLMDEYFKSKTYTLSEKQKGLIKKNAPDEIVALAEKDELTLEEFKEVKEWIDEYFESLR